MFDNQDILSNAVIEKFSNGDSESFFEIYNHFRSEIYLSIYRFLKSETSAEDAAVKVFIQLWEQRDGFENYSHVRTWLYQSARNSCVDLLRHYDAKEKTFNIITTIAHDEIQPHERISAAVITRIWKYIELMPKKQRKVYLSRNWDEKTVSEISDHLKISETSVIALNQKALQFLKSLFSGNIHQTVWFFIFLHISR